MKNFLLLTLITLVTFHVDAQVRRRTSAATSNPTRLSLGFDVGLPVGQYSDPYSVVVGGSLQVETMPASDLGLTLSVGYNNWSVKKTYNGGSVGFIPILGGVKYYFGGGGFLHPQIGAAVGASREQGTSFAYSPGIGYQFSRNVDATLKYTGFSNKGGSLNNVGIRLGFTF